MGNSLSDAVKRNGSNGSKPAKCVRECGAEIQPYSGRSVTRLSGTYAHHGGQCADTAVRERSTRAVAVQTSFAWSCATVTAGESEPELCNVAGAERTEYERHMRTAHGKTPVTPTQPMIRLRTSVPAGKRQVPRVPAFKRYTWSTTEHFPNGETGEHGEPLYTAVTAEHRGQFWANGAEANSVVVIEDMRAAGLPNRLVTLYVDSAGQLTADGYSAKRDRREAKRLAERNAA